MKTPEPSPFEAELATATAALRHGSKAYARALVRAIIERDPNCTAAWELLQEASQGLKPRLAPWVLAAAIRLKPLRPRWLPWLSAAWGRYRPTARLCHVLAHAAQGLQAPGLLRFAYEERIRLEPRALEPILTLGALYQKEHLHQKALHLGEWALRHHPHHPELQRLVKRACVALTLPHRTA